MHTHYSEDATINLQELVHYAEKKGLDGIAVTDHNTLQGALKLVKRSQLTVIPGLEVEALSGHLLALNIKTLIPSKLSIIETIQKIHDAGGVAVLAHPAAILKTGLKHRITPESNLDAVEVINSGAFPFFLSTYLSHRFAERIRLPQTAGSDAHHVAEIGTAFTLVDADPAPEEVAEAIRKGAIYPSGKSITWAQRTKRDAFYLTKIYRKC